MDVLMYVVQCVHALRVRATLNVCVCDVRVKRALHFKVTIHCLQ